MARAADPAPGGERPRGPRSRTQFPEVTIAHLPGPRCTDAGTSNDDALQEELRRDIAGLADEQGLRPDLIVVTGDLAANGLPGEYRRAIQWLAALTEAAGIPRRHVAVVPGSGDVNRRACEAYFLAEEANEQQPVPPYFPKWRAYAAAFAEFYADVPGVTFLPDEPWTLFEMPELRVALAGLNSTMAQTHRDDSQRAALGDQQLAWFSGRLPDRIRRAWLCLGAVHDHATQDFPDPEVSTGQAARLDPESALAPPSPFRLLLSSSLNGPRRLLSSTPVFPVGDGRYQVIAVRSDAVYRIGRRYTADGWTEDAASSERTGPALVIGGGRALGYAHPASPVPGTVAATAVPTVTAGQRPRQATAASRQTSTPAATSSPPSRSTSSPVRTKTGNRARTGPTRTTRSWAGCSRRPASASRSRPRRSASTTTGRSATCGFPSGCPAARPKSGRSAFSTGRRPARAWPRSCRCTASSRRRTRT